MNEDMKRNIREAIELWFSLDEVTRERLKKRACDALVGAGIGFGLACLLTGRPSSRTTALAKPPRRRGR